MVDTKRFEAHQIYRNKEGKRLCGVTTITDQQLGWNKRILINWANNLGLEGIDSSKYTDETADIGKLAHKQILNHFLNLPTDTTHFSQYETDSANLSYNKYLLWESKHEVKPILVEKPLVSEVYQYGGMFDYYGLVDNLRTLLDFKTGGGLYLEYWIQVAGGYLTLLLEHNHPVDQIILLNIPASELTPFQEQIIPKRLWLPCQQIFLNCLKNNELYKQLTKQVKQKGGEQNGNSVTGSKE